MRVLLVMDTLATGGTERQMEMLVRAWPRQHHIEVLAFSSDHDFLAHWGKFAAVHCVDRSRVPNWRLPSALASAARDGQADIILASHRFSGLVAKLARLGGLDMPIVTSIRGWHPWGRTQRIIYDHVDIWLLPLAAAVIVNARVQEEMLRRRRAGSARIHYVPNGVAAEVVAPQHGERVRVELGIPADETVIVSVARMVDVKNPLAAVGALERLHALGHRAHLLWVGDGPLRDAVLAHSRNTPVEPFVHLVGEQPDPGRFLAAADIYLNTSSWENTSNAILEAMAQSLPVVARNVGGNAEVILNAETGILCGSGAVDVLAGALNALSADPALRAKMGSRARETVLNRFSVARMVERHVQILDESLGAA